MPIYSHSQLSTYEDCPLRYKLRYRDKIKRYVEGIEGFLGTMVHETLKKCYDDARLTKVNTLDELLSIYDKLWQQNWHDSIVVTRKDVAADHYFLLGQQLLSTYYTRYAPFDSDRTIATEMRLNFPLGDTGQHKLIGFIDRLSRAEDGVYQIHDYKTSAHLPSQEEADNDRQLALYHIGIQNMWPDVKDIRLVWHYLAFDRELVSSRSREQISELVERTGCLIDEIEAAEVFPPNETGLCQWCEYPDLCPQRKHTFKVESLPVNEYLQEPGVVLVNRYAELKEKASEIDDELDKVKEAILAYARSEGVTVIRGSDCQTKIRFTEKLKFPGKQDKEHQQLTSVIADAGKWMEVSKLDTPSLVRVIEDGLWDKDLIEEIMKYGRIEESGAVYLSKLKDEEK